MKERPQKLTMTEALKELKEVLDSNLLYINFNGALIHAKYFKIVGDKLIVSGTDDIQEY